MADYFDIATRLVVDSDILRILPNAHIQFYTSGTATLIWEGNADKYGKWEIPTLVSGKYDIKVNGVLSATVHHVTADHTHKPNELWKYFKSGSIAADQDEVNTMEIYGSDVAGKIIQVKILVQSIDATGDMTVHLLRGAAGGSVLTVAGDSVWSHRVNPGSIQNRFMFVDNNPGITNEISVNDTLTVGIDYVAGTISGLTVIAIYRPN